MTIRLDELTRSAAALIGLCAIAAAGATASCFSERTVGPAGTIDIDPAICTGTRSANVVIIRGFTFEPTQLTVAAGTEVTWANCEAADSHTSTSDNGAWDSGLLAPMQGYRQTFSQTGQFPYHCEPHPVMVARIVVQ